MMPLLASNTLTPDQSATSSVNRPWSSTGTTTGTPWASAACWSSSPKPGAAWTTPGALGGIHEIGSYYLEGAVVGQGGEIVE